MDEGLIVLRDADGLLEQGLRDLGHALWLALMVLLLCLRWWLR